MTSLVLTTISSPQKVLHALAEGAREHGIPFYVIGDVITPKDFNLNGAEYFSIDRQGGLDFSYSAICPERNYARKNIGYLIAIERGATVIVETDDDNIPKDSFWNKRELEVDVEQIQYSGWFNVYSKFSKEAIWPRGFPLDKINVNTDIVSTKSNITCPIQQGLADKDPDVDAIYRMTCNKKVMFNDGRVALAPNTWCPFNSQNTTFFKQAFPLLYLPATCSIRMTDIWRSFIAQRICWENNWNILFHQSTVVQERNVHNLMKDFELEIPGYLNNDMLVKELQKLTLKKGEDYIAENLHICYDKFIELKMIHKNELKLLSAWLNDLYKFNS